MIACKADRTLFADTIRASSLHRLHQQAGQTTAPDGTSDHHFMLATREPSTEAVPDSGTKILAPSDRDGSTLTAHTFQVRETKVLHPAIRIPQPVRPPTWPSISTLYPVSSRCCGRQHVDARAFQKDRCHFTMAHYNPRRSSHDAYPFSATAQL